MFEDKTDLHEIYSDSFFPFTISWFLDFRCDLSCPFCFLPHKEKVENEIPVELICDKFKEKGVFEVNILGGESGSDDILIFYNKGYTSKDTIHAIHKCNKANIIPIVYIIVFSPIESIQTLKQTVNFLQKIHFSKGFFQIIPYSSPLPGTKLRAILDSKIIKRWVGGKRKTPFILKDFKTNLIFEKFIKDTIDSVYFLENEKWELMKNNDLESAEKIQADELILIKDSILKQPVENFKRYKEKPIAQYTSKEVINDGI
jgi:radical SAM superfamily enzyme YgiQ (UPF0313 family)